MADPNSTFQLNDPGHLAAQQLINYIGQNPNATADDIKNFGTRASYFQANGSDPLVSAEKVQTINELKNRKKKQQP